MVTSIAKEEIFEEIFFFGATSIITEINALKVSNLARRRALLRYRKYSHNLLYEMSTVA